MAYLALADPESGLEFEHYLALKLSRTVAELRRMSNDEFVRWQMYFGREAQRMEIDQAKGS